MWNNITGYEKIFISEILSSGKEKSYKHYQKIMKALGHIEEVNWEFEEIIQKTTFII